MANFAFSVFHDDLEYMATSLGYSYGRGGNVSWNESDARRIVHEWARKYDVEQHLRKINFFSGNLDVQTDDPIVNQVFVRTVFRPRHGSPMAIPNSPLPSRYESLLGDATGTRWAFRASQRRRFQGRLLVAAAIGAVLLVGGFFGWRWATQVGWPWAKAHPLLLALVAAVEAFIVASLVTGKTGEPAAGLGAVGVYGLAPAVITFALAYWWFGATFWLAVSIGLVACMIVTLLASFLIFVAE